MASGKQTPRQKMINLMYLVFIAMLALNMSKEVLTAFGLLNEKLTESNETTTQRNQAFMAGLAAKVDEQPAKYAPLKEKADRVDELSNNFTNYIEGLKTELTAKQMIPGIMKPWTGQTSWTKCSSPAVEILKKESNFYSKWRFTGMGL
jgi:gliding motility-associated protein GldM